jgi:type I restriction enzyme R subunit
MTETEAQLEESLVERLTGLGYGRVVIRSAGELLANLKGQLEKHNDTSFSDSEFSRVLNHLDKGNVFDRARTLRDKYALPRDDGSTSWIEFLNTAEWCRNEYQVTQQVSQAGSYLNRYDVTLLINGLPLVQIELKRRGLEMKEAFNQINRYQRHSFWSERGLFNYVQIFVISNGVNTKYYANQRRQSFKQTFFWARPDNTLITQLDEFTDSFLEKCHLSKMICRYIVLQETDRILMVLRPYQYYAVEAIAEQVKNSRDNGYVWHTTGSGKTLTSFKAAQILTAYPKVAKVVFVVDRADLDYQTTREFNHFSSGSVDGTSNTAALVKQFGDDSTKLIVTTIQKLNNAVANARYDQAMSSVKDKRIIFIFDECHRSQFGDTHKRITAFFTKAQMFGFTGTPIFADNANRNDLGKRTTKDLFGRQLHQYVITDAIRDENVLRFSVEYWGKLRRRDGSLIDDKVIGIDTKEFWENPERTDGIVQWIIANHGRKTHGRDFTAILAVNNVDTLTQYYKQIQARRALGEHDLRVVAIFSYGSNEGDIEADGLIGEPEFSLPDDRGQNRDSREQLDECISDYNSQFGSNFSTRTQDGFYNYYKDIGRRIKARDKDGFQDKDRIDILLVVNMFLTGFDAKKINTLYVDKNLKHHGLIQAYSRTNRIINDIKSQGNIVCFRNLKANTDEALALFSDKNANEIVLIEPYESYVISFNECVERLRAIAPNVQDVDTLESEIDQLEFVKAFRNIIRTMNVIKSFSQFIWADLDLEPQEFEDYKSKYLDMYDRARVARDGSERVSIIEEVDFELELIQRDEVNVGYILALLAKVLEARSSDDPEEQRTAESRKQAVLDMLGSEVQLRSKRELIEKFISEHLSNVSSAGGVESSFAAFWNAEREANIAAFCNEEGLRRADIDEMIAAYHFTQRPPLRERIISSLLVQPRILERKAIVQRVGAKLLDLIVTFDDA